MGCRLLTEQEVARSWQRLFSSPPITAETLDKAEALLEELRPESPLFHRLNTELCEVRKLNSPKAVKAPKGTKKKAAAKVKA